MLLFHRDNCSADLYEDEAIQPLLKYKSPWGQELKSSPGVEGDPGDVEHRSYPGSASRNQCFGSRVSLAFVIEGKLSSEEIEKMLKLPKKEYILL